MQEVRNSIGKLVCLIDKEEHKVEIVIKGCKTIIRFSENQVEIINTHKAA